MAFKKWCVLEYDKQLAKKLSEDCDADPIVALIASSRGYTDPMDLEQFLSDEPFFSDPRETADIILAADIINAAIEDGRKIAVYGDYDCDGVVATALLYSYLLSRGADCIYYLPDRFDEGYGMNVEAVRKIASENVNLIITVDNGITAIEEAALAKELGMDLVITDHHLPGVVLPAADAIVNPHRKDCPSTFKEICGAQVAFRLICVIENKEPEELLPYFADILTLAVVADVMPLTLENRSIVKYGIFKMKQSPKTGISALINVSGMGQKTINSSRIAFGLVPRINAAGRMGKAERAVELLTCDNMMRALEIANELDGQNALRQQIEMKIYEQAITFIENNNYKYDRIIVCEGEGWHHGVVGIVAAKIAEKYGRPAILISVDEDGTASGSGRSIEGFSLYDAIAATSEVLTKFGGHSQAAGISLPAENIPLFRQKINDYAFNTEYIPPILHIDCRLNISALTPELAVALKQLEPFGHENQVPVFGIYGVTLKKIIPIGNGRHLRLVFSKGENSFCGLLFGVSPENFCFEEGDILDTAVTVEENSYNGQTEISVYIKSLRMNGTDDDKQFADLSRWEAFLSGRETDLAPITPDRNEIAAVYKFICEKPVLADRIKY
ncbi:MAG: single-stranded-DNA-specific exonuclease RecJ, partial [Acutalibacteraceae bacterium]